MEHFILMGLYQPTMFYNERYYMYILNTCRDARICLMKQKERSAYLKSLTFFPNYVVKYGRDMFFFILSLSLQSLESLNHENIFAVLYISNF